MYVDLWGSSVGGHWAPGVTWSRSSKRSRSRTGCDQREASRRGGGPCGATSRLGRMVGANVASCVVASVAVDASAGGGVGAGAYRSWTASEVVAAGASRREVSPPSPEARNRRGRQTSRVRPSWSARPVRRAATLRTSVDAAARARVYRRRPTLFRVSRRDRVRGRKRGATEVRVRT